MTDMTLIIGMLIVELLWLCLILWILVLHFLTVKRK